MEEGRLPKEIMKWSPPGRRKQGRPKLTWAEGIRVMMGEKGLKEEDWNERGNWSKKIIVKEDGRCGKIVQPAEYKTIIPIHDALARFLSNSNALLYSHNIIMCHSQALQYLNHCVSCFLFSVTYVCKLFGVKN